MWSYNTPIPNRRTLYDEVSSYNYKEEYCSLLQRNVLLVNEYASLLHDINKLKLNKKHWTLEKYKHFLILAKMHKRAKLTTNDIIAL